MNLIISDLPYFDQSVKVFRTCSNPFDTWSNLTGKNRLLVIHSANVTLSFKNQTLNCIIANIVILAFKIEINENLH